MRCPALIVFASSASLLAACGTDTDSSPAAAATTAAPPAVPPGDWPAYNRTLAGDRFSPLDEIDRGNVEQLQTICTYTLPEVSSLQTGPIVVAGTMYFTTDTRSYAVDAATCAERWQVERVGERRSFLGVHRGFAYLDGRLFRGTSDGHVLALDASDGRTLWDSTIPDDAPGVSMPMAPIAANGLVLIGHAGGDQTGVVGHVYAFDAADGRLVWRFEVVPDEPAVRATWPNADRYPITGGAFWTSFTLDETTGVLYVPAGNPAPDFDIEARGGDNLYSNSVIALEAATGRMLGYNQIVKNDNHDWDVNSPPTLATTRENVDVPLSRTAPVRFCPGIQGGNEWNGAAFHPGVNALYTGAVDWCATVQLADEVEVPPAGQIWFGSRPGDIQAPPSTAKGWLTAFDADTGVVKWKFEAVAPVVAAVTPTAGGLVFSADLRGGLRAFDAESGAVLWEVDTGQSIGGGIVSYAVGGRQRIAVASGMKSPIWPGAADQSRIQVLGLP